MVSEEKKSILLTFDVEDWFQVENFKEYISFSSWDSHELRVEKNTNLILDLLDSFTFKPKATFFVLGWIAQKVPHLVREIHARGHEVANHGNHHHLCTNLNSEQIIEDLKAGKEKLEDITGSPVYGYRAPSFAINNDILKLVKETGHLYDSSFNSFSMHGRYGTIDIPEDSDFFELPVSNLTVFNKVFPLGGGGYFRLMPSIFFESGMKQVLKKNDFFLFYSHPWEFDPGQPRVDQASPGFKFRHYINLRQTEKKLSTLINNFGSLNFVTCSDYINSKKNN